MKFVCLRLEMNFKFLINICCGLINPLMDRSDPLDVMSCNDSSNFVFLGEVERMFSRKNNFDDKFNSSHHSTTRVVLEKTREKRWIHPLAGRTTLKMNVGIEVTTKSVEYPFDDRKKEAEQQTES